MTDSSLMNFLSTFITKGDYVLTKVGVDYMSHLCYIHRGNLPPYGIQVTLP